MKNRKVLVVCVMIFVLLISFTACGNETTLSSDEQVDDQEAVEQQDNSEQVDDQPADEQQTADQQATDQQETEEMVVPTPEPKSSVESLIGSWTDISYPERFANITKTGQEYQYEDNDGKYPATFKDGVLKVKVSDTDTADVYFDENTGHMLATYMGETLEYQKKQ